MEYVTLQDIGKARWRAKRTLPGCLGDRTLRSERRCHHTGAEEAATRAYSPSDYSAGRWMETLVTEDFDENLFVGDVFGNFPLHNFKGKIKAKNAIIFRVKRKVL